MDKTPTIPLLSRLASEGKTAEYLLWFGSMGRFDKNSRADATYFASLLAHAGVSFATLGEEESDIADEIRYSGDEYSFEICARRNIAAIGKYGISKIITPCPHSYTAFKNYYPALGGHYQVWHHSQFLLGLIKEGRIKPRTVLSGKKATYHDPCRLSRAGITDAPREIIHLLGGELLPAKHDGKNSMCCGGGAYLSSTDIPQKVASMRLCELKATGAEAIITSCPVCRSMLSSAGDTAMAQNAVTDICRLIQPE